MKVLGLTGGIAMGKTTVARQFVRLGARHCDADAIVHHLMDKGGKAVSAIEEHFPSAVTSGAVDRKALGAIVFRDQVKLKLLESILHPLVIAEENDFIRRQRMLGHDLVVLDIPLLFETMGHLRCDATVSVTCSPLVQRLRALRRPGMTEDKLKGILSRQWPDWKRRSQADYVIQTGGGKAASFEAARQVIHCLNERLPHL